MFNYTRSVILNTKGANTAALQYAAAKAKLEADAQALDAAAAVTEVSVAGSAGTPGEYTLPTPSGAGRLLRVFVKVYCPSRYLAEMGLANWQEFARGIMFECEDGTAATLEKNANEAVKNLDFKPYSVAGSTLTLCDARLVAEISAEEEATAGAGDFAPVTIAAPVQAPAAPLFDYEWMIANVCFPTSENVRFAAPGEKPVPGAIYDCKELTLTCKRNGLGGASAVGQEVTSVTRHIFYVQQ